MWKKIGVYSPRVGDCTIERSYSEWNILLTVSFNFFSEVYGCVPEEIDIKEEPLVASPENHKVGCIPFIVYSIQIDAHFGSWF